MAETRPRGDESLEVQQCGRKKRIVLKRRGCTYRRGALALAAEVSHFFIALRLCESVTQFFCRCRRRRICALGATSSARHCPAPSRILQSIFLVWPISSRLPVNRPPRAAVLPLHFSHLSSHALWPLVRSLPARRCRPFCVHPQRCIPCAAPRSIRSSTGTALCRATRGADCIAGRA